MPACVLAVLACVRARGLARSARLLPCLLPRLPAYLRPCPYAWPACSRCSRLYCSFSRRALARCSARCARRKLFRDRFQAVDIYPAVIGMGGRHDFILLCGLIWGRGDSVAISWYICGLKKSFAMGLTDVERCGTLSVSQGQAPKGRTQARHIRPTGQAQASPPIQARQAQPTDAT